MPMRFSWAKTSTMDEISRVNRGLMCPAVTTGCVPGGVCGGGHCASHRGHCGPEPTNVGDPCGRLAPRVARIHRTPGERSCTGVIETRNRSAWATLRFGANKFNHLSICAREGPLTDFLSFFYPRKSSCRNANSPRRADISRGEAERRRRGEFESYAGCFMKISLHPIGEGTNYRQSRNPGNQRIRRRAKTAS